MLTRNHWIILVVALISGCGPTYPPISIDAAKGIKSGTPLSEIETALGPSHPPTSTQERQLDGVMSKMSPHVRANAESDTTLAWGDDNDFLVVKVNEEGTAWVVAWRSK